MADRWKVAIERPAGHDGAVPLVPYGPAGDKLPAAFDAVVDYVERPLRVRIAATFNGRDRVHATVVAVERTDGASVSPEDMTATELGAVMRSVVWKAALRYASGGVVAQGGRTRTGPPSDDELFTLARTYWFEHLSWGKPRQAVMSTFELPRSTASVWIRKARDKYGLPGLHAEDGA